MTIIRTDLGDTKENAKRLRYEPSAANAETNVQDAIEFVSAAIVTPATAVVAATSAITTAMVSVQTNQAAPIVLTLPLSAAWSAENAKYGVPLSIFDISGTGSVNTVTIQGSGGQTIAGLASIVINADFGGYRLQPKSGGGWIMV